MINFLLVMAFVIIIGLLYGISKEDDDDNNKNLS